LGGKSGEFGESFQAEGALGFGQVLQGCERLPGGLRQLRDGDGAEDSGLLARVQFTKTAKTRKEFLALFRRQGSDALDVGLDLLTVLRGDGRQDDLALSRRARLQAQKPLDGGLVGEEFSLAACGQLIPLFEPRHDEVAMNV